ncbi:GNAT family N-acetyltransferase [Mycolicibacterium komossense]|uniref:GNAT family N-acetyltransferase n=1 Tax=Mycolicibacterium komossense TaxID=1779 RepID=UPI0021F385BC|nr:GNAT family N-acetyltransferase [Mycolicibacterium komossense]
MAELIYRTSIEQDYPDVVAALSLWWDNPEAQTRRSQRVALVPRLFFQHFTDTTLIVRHEDRLVAFLIGFLSQSRPDEAYIHFVGVEPRHQGRGIGADLYERFFAVIRENRRRKVLAITTGSQAFHRRLGFTVSDSIGNYDGQGGVHVTFSREL